MKNFIVILAFLVTATVSAFAQDGQAKAIALSNQADSLFNQGLNQSRDNPDLVEQGLKLNAQALAQPNIGIDLYQDIIEHRYMALSKNHYMDLSKNYGFFSVSKELEVGNYNLTPFNLRKVDQKYYDIIKQKAESGNSDAMSTLADLCVSMAKYESRLVTIPHPTKPNKTKKIVVEDWFTPDGEIALDKYKYWKSKAIELGNRTTMWTLGSQYLFGSVERANTIDWPKQDTIVCPIATCKMEHPIIVLKYNYDKGIELLEKASEAGSFFATERLRYAYRNKKDGSEEDKQKIQQCHRKIIELAKKNNYNSVIWEELKLQYCESDQEIIDLYEYLATNNDKDAMTILGNYYMGLYGNGIPIDLTKAQEWYAKAENEEGLKRCSTYIEEQKTGKPAKIYNNVRQRYGRMFWKNGSLVNESGKIIVAAKKYDNIFFETNVIIVKKNNKYGAVTYTGTQIIAPIHDKFEGTGAKEGRLVFSDNTTNGVKLFIYSTAGQLVTSRAFTNSQVYLMAAWMRDWLINLSNPVYSD
jgi:TPR repeat protein